MLDLRFRSRVSAAVISFVLSVLLLLASFLSFDVAQTTPAGTGVIGCLEEEVRSGRLVAAGVATMATACGRHETLDCSRFTRRTSTGVAAGTTYFTLGGFSSVRSRPATITTEPAITGQAGGFESIAWSALPRAQRAQAGFTFCATAENRRCGGLRSFQPKGTFVSGTL